VHQVAGHPSPRGHRLVKETWNGIRRRLGVPGTDRCFWSWANKTDQEGEGLTKVVAYGSGEVSSRPARAGNDRLFATREAALDQGAMTRAHLLPAQAGTSLVRALLPGTTTRSEAA
jgi:hypothetical protein